MLAGERRQRILERLREAGRVLSSELSVALAVSEDTIRRDLHDLAEAGLLQRVHGGALPRSPAAAPYATRQGQATSAKLAIARAAAQLISDGQVIVLDGGTTTLEVARALPLALRATILTNSPPIAVALAEYPAVEVVLVGGRLLKESLVTVGAETVDTLRGVRADICLLGVCSLHPEVGISVPMREEALVKRAMVAGSGEVVALASAEKLGTAAPYVVGPLSLLTHLITDKGVTEATLAPYRNLALTIVQG